MFSTKSMNTYHKNELWILVSRNDILGVKVYLDNAIRGGISMKNLFKQAHRCRLLVGEAVSVEMVELLVSYGAKLDMYHDELSLLDIACRNSLTGLVKYYISLGYVNRVDKNGHCMAFELAVKNSNLEVCKLLVDAGCRIDPKFKHGTRTPLQICVMNQGVAWGDRQDWASLRQHRIIVWLLSLKVPELRVFHRDRTGFTALEYAMNSETRKLIKRHMISELVLVMRSTLYYPRLSPSKKLAKLTPDLLRLVCNTLTD